MSSACKREADLKPSPPSDNGKEAPATAESGAESGSAWRSWSPCGVLPRVRGLMVLNHLQEVLHSRNPLQKDAVFLCLLIEGTRHTLRGQLE